MNINYFEYCFIGVIELVKCFLGYKEYDGFFRVIFNDICEFCFSGIFGADFNRVVCEICRAGIVCLFLATFD